jgi:hypothetical protein
MNEIAPSRSVLAVRHWLADRSFPLGLLTLTGLATAAVFGLPASPPRTLAAGVIALGPGCALVPLIGIPDRGAAALAALLVSVSALVVVAQAVTYVAGFSWRPCALAMLALTLGGIAAQVLRPHMSRSGPS